MKRIVFLLFLIFPVSAYSAAKVQSLTATYIPSEIGLETEVTLTYKFIKAGGLQVAMSASSRKHGSGAYWWKGTRYTAEELGSAAFDGLKFRTPNIEVDVYNGVIRVGSFRQNYVLEGMAGPLGESYNLTQHMGIKASDVPDEQMGNWSLKNLRIESAGLSPMGSMNMQSVIREFAKGKAYTRKIQEADELFQSKRYADAANLYREAASLEREEDYPKKKLEEIAALQREAEKAEHAERLARADRLAKAEQEREEQQRAKEAAEAASNDYSDGNFWNPGGTESGTTGEASTTGTDTSGTGAKSWTSGTGGTAESPSTGGTGYARSTDGGYFRRGSDGQYQEINMDDYHAGRAREQEQRNQQAEALKRQQESEAVAQFNANQRRQQANIERAHQEIDRKANSFAQSYYAGQLAGQARSNIDQLSDMRGDYSSAQELERD